MLWPRNVSIPRAAPTGVGMPSWNGLDSVSMKVRPLSRLDTRLVVEAEPALDDVAAPLAEEAVEHAVAAAQHGLVVELVGEAHARHDVVLRRRCRGRWAARSRLGTSGRRATLNWSPDDTCERRVRATPGRRLHRLRRVEVEAANAAIVRLRRAASRTRSADRGSASAASRSSSRPAGRAPTSWSSRRRGRPADRAGRPAAPAGMTRTTARANWGASAELSSGPRVHVASKLNWPVWSLPKKTLGLAIAAELHPRAQRMRPFVLFTVAVNDCVSVGRSSPPTAVP